ncbi:hypothetical protein CWI75_04045 [Kineobactrum sediminis]|uniref:Methyltransferase type 11 domain-containing protein n=1 Tax=Kineobactrum sediminis TaxID=1905677 RepID=A0A2N5Y562_9GAMM|nr:class I SAM-dependent methyltransferase [Kineobactrum sediminis]PLW83533.1 hypothetical protein CWI75_04045 [Kineobactrum sediminis]
MNEVPEKSAITSAWDVYWQYTPEQAAYQQGGPQEALLETFWLGLLRERARATPGLRWLDLACGNGAVMGFAQQAMPGSEAFCSDYSQAALTSLQQRYPRAQCVVADARCTPFADAGFDLVVSQFGVEYAGADAVLEAARLVAPGGTLAVVIHLRDGAIFRECERNRDVIRAVQATEILPLARVAFAAGFAAMAGSGTRETFVNAEQSLTPAVKALENVLKDAGPNIAQGLPQRLYKDIAHMYGRMSAYDENDVMAWIERMEEGLAAYIGRMQTMLDAAMDADALAEVIARLEAAGLQCDSPARLSAAGHEFAAAWTLVGSRSPNPKS